MPRDHPGTTALGQAAYQLDREGPDCTSFIRRKGAAGRNRPLALGPRLCSWLHSSRRTRRTSGAREKRILQQFRESCPPKAEVTGSNPVGRANQINDLRKSLRRRARGKLTTNSPAERAYWRVIGGHFVTLLP